MTMIMLIIKPIILVWQKTRIQIRIRITIMNFKIQIIKNHRAINNKNKFRICKVCSIYYILNYI